MGEGGYVEEGAVYELSLLAFNEVIELESDRLKVVGFSEEARGRLLDESLLRDLALVGFVIISALVVITVQSGSLFIGLVGTLEVVLAIPVAIFFYTTVFGNTYFGILNVLSFFLLVGIGCDDVFVLADAWRQSAVLFTDSSLSKQEQYRARVHWALTSCGSSLFVTSSTTAVAFFGCIISSIPPLRAFGIFAAFVVVADYVLTITFLMAMLVVHEEYVAPVEKKICAILLPCQNRRRAKPQEAVVEDVTADGPTQESEGPAFRTVERYFLTTHSKLIQRGAPYILVLATIWVTASVISIFEIEAARGFTLGDMFPAWHNHNIADVLRRNLKSTQTATIAPHHLVWGMEEVDDFNVLEADRKQGEPYWGPPTYKKLIAWTQEEQAFFAKACSMLFERTDLVSLAGDFTCAILRVKRRLADDGEEFPTTPERFREAAKSEGWDLDGPTIFVVYGKVGFEADLSDLRADFAKWEDFMESVNEEAVYRGVPHLKGYQTSILWLFPMETAENFVSSFREALIVSLISAWFVLAICMRNWILATQTIVAMLAVVTQVLGLLVISGRKFGMIEALACSLLVGLAVDYLAHVAKGYTEAPPSWSPMRRCSYSLARVGISIMSGAFTTAIAGFFLLQCLLSFFSFFGFFLVGLVLLASFTTLVVFPSFLSLFGPVGDAGSCESRSAAPKSSEDDLGHINVAYERMGGPAGLDEPSSTDRRKSRAIGILCSPIFVVGVGVRSAVYFELFAARTDDCSEPPVIELFMDDEQLTDEITQYRCRVFEDLAKKDRCTYYATGFEFINKADDPKVVHHIIVQSLAKPHSSSCSFGCFDMPESISLVFGWAVGMGNVMLPEGTGIEMGGGSKNRILAMQMHYDNRERRAGLVDRGTGIRVLLTAEKPATEIINVLAGLTPLTDRMRIPVDMQDFLVSSKCRTSLLNPVTIYGYSLHAHIYGTKIIADVIRDGKVVFEIGREPSYSFDFQQFVYYKDINLPTLELRDGDLIRTRCWYDTRRSRYSFRESSLTTESNFHVALTQKDRSTILAHMQGGSRVNESLEVGGKLVSPDWTLDDHSPGDPSNASNPWNAHFRADAVGGGFGSGDEMCMSVLIMGHAKDVRDGGSCLVSDAETMPFAAEE
jgi:hypothetical protein